MPALPHGLAADNGLHDFDALCNTLRPQLTTALPARLARIAEDASRADLREVHLRCPLKTTAPSRDAVLVDSIRVQMQSDRGGEGIGVSAWHIAEHRRGDSPVVGEWLVSH